MLFSFQKTKMLLYELIGHDFDFMNNFEITFFNLVSNELMRETKKLLCGYFSNEAFFINLID